MFIVDEGDQKVFEGRVLVATTAGFRQRVVEGLFEFASETGHLVVTPARSPEWAGLSSGMSYAANAQSRGLEALIPRISLRKLVGT